MSVRNLIQVDLRRSEKGLRATSVITLLCSTTGHRAFVFLLCHSTVVLVKAIVNVSRWIGSVQKTIILLTSIFILFLIGLTWVFISKNSPLYATSDDRFAACRGSTVMGGAGTIGGPFTLLNTEGQTVTEKDVITEPTLVYFGYTFCPDVCPLDAARNAEVVDLLADKRRSATPVFISIDPKRDTPEVMKDYAKWLHPKMIGLTGSAEQVKAASKAYRTYYKSHEADDDEFYLVDHSTMTYLVLPEHGFVEFFRRDQSAEAIAEKSMCFIDRA